MSVAVGGDDLENSVMQLENRNIKSSAAQVVDGDNAVLLFIEAIGERCRGRFIHQP